MSMFVILDNAKEIVCLAGRGGILWTDVVSQLALAKGSPIASHIFHRFRQANYLIEPKPVSASSSSSSSSSLSNNDKYLITASLEDRYRAVGISSLTDFPPNEPFLTILDAFASVKQRGLTIIELANYIKMLANTCHPSLEKLVKLQVLVKSSISPIKTSKSPRSSHRLNIYHLKRFFHLYQPEEEGMMMNMDETSSLRLQTIVLDILGRNGLEKMSVCQLCLQMSSYRKLKTFKRELQHMMNFLKDKCLLVLFNERYHTRKRTPNVTVRRRPCIGIKSKHAPQLASSAACEGGVLPLQTARNMAQYEQLADRLNVAPCGLPSNQMASLLDVSRRRLSTMIQTLTTDKRSGQYNYSLKKMRAGKVSVHVMLGKELRVTLSEQEQALKLKLRREDAAATATSTAASDTANSNDMADTGDTGDTIVYCTRSGHNMSSSNSSSSGSRSSMSRRSAGSRSRNSRSSSIAVENRQETPVLLGTESGAEEQSLSDMEGEEEEKQLGEEGGEDSAGVVTGPGPGAGLRNLLFADMEDRHMRLLYYVEELGGMCDHVSFAIEEGNFIDSHGRIDKRTICRLMEKCEAEDQGFVMRDVSMKPYKIGLVSVRCLLAQAAITAHRRHYPPNTPDEEVITDMIHNYFVRYFAPWRRLGFGRGPFLQFVVKRNGGWRGGGAAAAPPRVFSLQEEEGEEEEEEEETDHSPSVLTHCNLRNWMTEKEEETRVGDDEMEQQEEQKKNNKKEDEEQKDAAWVCDRNSKCDLMDKLVNHTFHIDALKILLSIPPTYPVTASSGSISHLHSLNLNDIQARFMHVVKHGAATNDPCRVLTPADFLCSTRILHSELLRQTNKVRNACREGKERTFRLPTQLFNGQYPFTLDEALARLPVRLIVRNYGLPPAFRRTVTRQLLDRAFILQGDLCYEQRVLTHAVRHSRTSMDALLKNPHSEVNELGRAMLQHAKVQAVRELKFLEAFNCVIKRSSASLPGEEGEEEGGGRYFYCARPVISMKYFAHLKCIFNYWDSTILPHLASVGVEQLNCSTGELAVLPSHMTTRPASPPPSPSPSPSPATVTLAPPLPLVPPPPPSGAGSTAKPGVAARKKHIQLQRRLAAAAAASSQVQKKRRRSVEDGGDGDGDGGGDLSAQSTDTVLICLSLWKLFLPHGIPDALKPHHTQTQALPLTQTETEEGTSLAPSLHSPAHPTFWQHPRHQALPNHAFTPAPSGRGMGTANSLLAGLELQHKIGTALGKKKIDPTKNVTLLGMISRLLMAGTDALRYLCDQFESVYLEDELQGQGSDVLRILNELLLEARLLEREREGGGGALLSPSPSLCLPSSSLSQPPTPALSSESSSPVLSSLPLPPPSSSLSAGTRSCIDVRESVALSESVSVSTLLTACMTRTLQVYMSHPSFHDTLTGTRRSDSGGEGVNEGDGDDENENDNDNDDDDADGDDVDNNRRLQTFYANLSLLRAFPLMLVTDVHRELYVKKMIKRRVDSAESNVSMNLSDSYLLNGGYQLSSNFTLFFTGDPAVSTFTNLQQHHQQQHHHHQCQGSVSVSGPLLTRVGCLQLATGGVYTTREEEGRSVSEAESASEQTSPRSGVCSSSNSSSSSREERAGRWGGGGGGGLFASALTSGTARAGAGAGGSDSLFDLDSSQLSSTEFLLMCHLANNGMLGAGGGGGGGAVGCSGKRKESESGRNRLLIAHETAAKKQRSTRNGAGDAAATTTTGGGEGQPQSQPRPQGKGFDEFSFDLSVQPGSFSSLNNSSPFNTTANDNNTHTSTSTSINTGAGVLKLKHEHKHVGAVHRHYGHQVFNTLELDLDLSLGLGLPPPSAPAPLSPSPGQDSSSAPSPSRDIHDGDSGGSIGSGSDGSSGSSGSSCSEKSRYPPPLLAPALSACLLQACADPAGAFFSAIVTHFLRHAQQHQEVFAALFPYDVTLSEHRSRLERDLGRALDQLTHTFTPPITIPSNTLEGGESSAQPLSSPSLTPPPPLMLYELPVFSMHYEQLPGLRHFVLPRHLSLHSADPLTLEGCCPWMHPPLPPSPPTVLITSTSTTHSAAAIDTDIGTDTNTDTNTGTGTVADCTGRNERVYSVLVAKLLAVLARQPRTRARHLHAEVRAVLSVTQLCLLLQTMLDAGLVECSEDEDEEEDAGERKDVFFDEDAFFNQSKHTNKRRRRILSQSQRKAKQSAQHGHGAEGAGSASKCVSFRHKFFSLRNFF